MRLGAKHLPPSVRPWMGGSIGWWDGATLVVETTNFHPREGYRLWFMMSPQARVTERFTRVSKTELRAAVRRTMEPKNAPPSAGSGLNRVPQRSETAMGSHIAMGRVG